MWWLKKKRKKKIKYKRDHLLQLQPCHANVTPMVKRIAISSVYGNVHTNIPFTTSFMHVINWSTGRKRKSTFYIYILYIFEISKCWKPQLLRGKDTEWTLHAAGCWCVMCWNKLNGNSSSSEAASKKHSYHAHYAIYHMQEE